MSDRKFRCPTTINFHREVYEAVKRAAWKQGLSITDLIEKIVKEKLEVKE